MKIKKLLFLILRYSGLSFLFRRIIQRDKVTILLFHDISSKTANTTFKFLNRNYNIIDLDDYINAIENKNSNSIPPRALIITFDDGHIRNHSILSVIKTQRIPITIFLCAGIINTRRHFWFRTDISPQLVSQMKKVSNEKRLEILSTQYNYQQNREYNNLQALQRNQITDMRNLVNFQSHTMFHPILPMCKDDDARFEIFHSKYILESEYGLKINAIAYPNGDYCERDIQIVKKAGYKCGITVDYGFNSLETDQFKLKRISVNDTKDINELIVKSSGLWAFLKTRFLKKQKNNYAKWEV